MIWRQGIVPVILAVCFGGSSMAFASTPVHSIRQDMGPINDLLHQHGKIVYRVALIRGGVRTVTTSADPAVVAVIKVHAWEMKARMEQGNVIRPSDPLFAELFKRHRDIRIRMREVPNGVVESETSKDREVVLLIRAHAKAVALFVRDGMPQARIMTPLPSGYRGAGR